MNFEEIENELKAGKDIEMILDKINWKEFERFAQEVFSINGYKIRENFRFKTQNRFEIDILGINDNFIFCVDCKQWRRGRNKYSGMKNAVKKQEKRVAELKKFLKNNIIAKKSLGIKKQKYYSLLVSLFEENIIKENETYIVPSSKLNSFLLEVEKYLE